MSEMIERVAREIAHLVMAQSDNGVPEKASDWRNEARQIIAAMREPTEGMIFRGGLNHEPADTESIWRAMIDAALGEEERL